MVRRARNAHRWWAGRRRNSDHPNVMALIEAARHAFQRSRKRHPPGLGCESKRALDSQCVSAEQVALIPQCVECGVVWLPADSTRWEAYLTDDEPPELAFYCPDCAEREFRG